MKTWIYLLSPVLFFGLFFSSEGKHDTEPLSMAEITAIYPEENGKLIYKPKARESVTEPLKSHIQLDIDIKNKSNSALVVDKVVLTFPATAKQSAKTVTLKNELQISCNEEEKQNKLSIAPNQTCRLLLLPDQEVDFPAPASITIKVFLKGDDNNPLIIKRDLAAYQNTVQGNSYRFPGKASDLKEGEFWGGATSEGGTSHHRESKFQMFAHDMGVVRWDKNSNKWTQYYPGTDGAKNTDYLIWGKPIYAMADGEVLDFAEGNPDDPPHGDLGKPANSFTILHGEERAWYGHLQQGSLNPELCKKGAKVKSGQFLGRAGNSGHTSNPHLHIHISKKGVGYPILFHGIQVTGREKVKAFTDIDKNIWTTVTDKGLPYGKNLIWPSDSKPSSKPRIDGKFAGVFTYGTDGYYMWTGADWASFNSKIIEYSKMGAELIDLDLYEENGKRYYNGVWRTDNRKHGVHSGNWEQFKEWRESLNQKNFRLIDVEIFKEDGQWKYIGIWEPGNDKYGFYAGMNWADFTQNWADLNGQGLRLVDVEIYKVKNEWKYAGVWREGTDK